METRKTRETLASGTVTGELENGDFTASISLEAELTSRVLDDGEGGMMYPVTVKREKMSTTSGLYVRKDGSVHGAISMAADQDLGLEFVQEPAAAILGLDAFDIGARGKESVRVLAEALLFGAIELLAQLDQHAAGSLPAVATGSSNDPLKEVKRIFEEAQAASNGA